jgi:hypothetical protein
MRENVPKDVALWNTCKTWARSKYDVWPSAYTVGACRKDIKVKVVNGRKKKRRNNGTYITFEEFLEKKNHIVTQRWS